MSSSLPKIEPSQPSSSLESLPAALESLTALNEEFQKTTEALRVLCEPHSAQAGDAVRSAAPDSAAEGETRCLYFSPEALQGERELLRRYHAEDFCGLLRETHTMLVGLISVMKSINHSARIKGYMIAALGRVLEQVSTLVERMRNVYSEAKQV